jgi:predicted permease
LGGGPSLDTPAAEAPDYVLFDDDGRVVLSTVRQPPAATPELKAAAVLERRLDLTLGDTRYHALPLADGGRLHLLLIPAPTILDVLGDAVRLLLLGLSVLAVAALLTTLTGNGGVDALLDVVRGSFYRRLLAAVLLASIVPLVAAGLMLRSFVNLTSMPLGFNPEQVVTAKVPFSLREFPDPMGRWRLHRAIVADVEKLPGVQAVSGVTTLPFEPNFGAWRFGRVDGPTGNDRSARRQAILPGYLRVMGIDLIQGRDITVDDLDGARDVAIVDERFAAEFLTGDAVGQRVRMGSGPAARLLEIIGVVRSTRVEDARDRSFPHVFVPYHLWAVDLRLVIRTNRSAAEIAPLVKRTAESHGTRRAAHDIQPMAALVANSVSDARFMMLVLVGFAGMSVLLAAVGLYGTLAYLISRRRQEFGVRLAVGAAPHQIVALVAREGGLLTSVGAIVGLAGAFAATGMLRGLLFGVAPSDPVTLTGVSGVVVLVAVVAVIHPAWRASRVDPNVVLRVE